MTAALIVLLAQDGKLKFSDPVSTYVPDVPNGENITVAQLLKMRSGLYGYTADPDALGRHGCRPEQGLDAAGGVGHRVPASAAVRARRLLRVQQHQLRAARSHRREGRRAPVGPAVPGPAVRSGRPRRRRRFPPPTTPPSRLPTHTATCTAEASTHSPTTRIPPTCRPPHRPERCSRSTTPTRTPPTPPPPGARSPRPTTWPRG